jgi:hypothetical protein
MWQSLAHIRIPPHCSGVYGYTTEKMGQVGGAVVGGLEVGADAVIGAGQVVVDAAANLKNKAFGTGTDISSK